MSSDKYNKERQELAHIQLLQWLYSLEELTVGAMETQIQYILEVKDEKFAIPPVQIRGIWTTLLMKFEEMVPLAQEVNRIRLRVGHLYKWLPEENRPETADETLDRVELALDFWEQEKGEEKDVNEKS